MDYDNEIGRDLGYDLAKYGWVPKADAPVDVREGFIAAKVQLGAKSEPPDRFVRKWLQLRQNALRRGRVVDHGITPEYIQTIDYDSCPVTLCEMTHGARQDTDWSVDRVNNDGGYADGNLIVMSVRANKAKGDLSFREVDELAAAKIDRDGMTAKEWARLRCIMAGPCNPISTLNEGFPLLTRIANRCTRPGYYDLQHVLILLTRKNSSERNEHVRQLCLVHPDRAEAVELLKKCLSRLNLAMKNVEHQYDACEDTQFQTLLVQWNRGIPDLRRSAFNIVLRSIAGGQMLSPTQVKSWSLDNRGYYK